MLTVTCASGPCHKVGTVLMHLDTNYNEFGYLPVILQLPSGWSLGAKCVQAVPSYPVSAYCPGCRKYDLAGGLDNDWPATVRSGGC